MYCDELYHHGVKGMRWGVRRYQNYDGTYTQKGLARYKSAVEDYTALKKSYKEVSAQKGKRSPEARDLKNKMTAARRDANNTYRNLVMYKTADKGKRRVARGDTITGNNRKTLAVALASGAALTLGYKFLNSDKGQKFVANMPFGDFSRNAQITQLAMWGAQFAAASYGAAKYVQSQQIRSYYNATQAKKYKKRSG